MELSSFDGAAPCDPLTHCSPAGVAPASRESRMRARENHDVRGLGAVLPSLGDRSRPVAAVGGDPARISLAGPSWVTGLQPPNCTPPWLNPATTGRSAPRQSGRSCGGFTLTAAIRAVPRPFCLKYGEKDGLEAASLLGMTPSHWTKRFILSFRIDVSAR
jgi:hypothetical protein